MKTQSYLGQPQSKGLMQVKLLDDGTLHIDPTISFFSIINHPGTTSSSPLVLK